MECAWVRVENFMSPMVRTPLTTEHAVLGLLFREPMHGYELHRRITDTTELGGVWRIPQNKLYALLSRLEQEGYVTTQIEQPSNRPPRKVFHLTEAGRETFRTWMNNPVQQGRKLRLEFLVKLYFACHQGTTQALTLVENQRRACLAWLQSEQSYTNGGKQPKDYHWLVHQFRIGQLEAMVSWLDLCRQTLIDHKG